MEFDAVLLSRIQFGFTLAFHILFPTLTIGLGLLLAIVEAQWLRTRDEAWKALWRFWSHIFALAFGMGVVSGVVLSFEFGMNFSRFSEATGDVLGPLLGYEVLTAFFLEAGFLGIMLFGWKLVGDRIHFMATCMVAIGTSISAFWILAANSWMHTPDGFELIDGVFKPVDWLAVIFNPSFPYRFLHMTLASWMTASFVMAGVCALLILRGRTDESLRKGFRLALLAAAIVSPAQIFVGDLSGLAVREHQPIKLAAIEAVWETEGAVPFHIFTWPDMEAEENRFSISIPYGASLITTHDPDGVIQGLKSVPREDRPYVTLVFFSFRIMVGIGFALLGLAMWGLWLRRKRRLFDSKLFQRACVAAMPLGFVATIMGWITAEAGRQPWVVQGLMRTKDAASDLAPESVATSLLLFFVVYNLLLATFLFFLWHLIRRGPDAAPEPNRTPEGGQPRLASWHGADGN
jgi:cytochrome d ubiquinol oxidase subunit I